MRDRQDKKEDQSTETPNESASKRKLEDKKRAALDSAAEDDRHICRGTD